MHDSWGAGDGLPSIEVQALHQARDGDLWISTRNGLARFDGVHFEVFDLENTAAFVTDQFGDLAESPDGSVWIASRGSGLYRYRDGQFDHFDAAAPPRREILSLLADPEGLVWAGTRDGLALWQDGLWQHLDVPSLAGIPVTALARAPDGVVWIGTAGRGLVRYRQRRYETITLASPTLRLGEDGRLERQPEVVRDLLADDDGSLWVATSQGLQQVRDGLARPVDVAGPSPAQGEPGGVDFVDLLRDHGGRLWAASAERLYRHDGERFLEAEFPVALAALGHPADSSARKLVITCLQADREGGVWIGTYGRGLHRYGLGAVRPYLPRHGLAPGPAASVLQRRDGSLLVGSVDGSVGRILDAEGRERVDTLWRGDEVPFDELFALVEDRRGRLFVGSRNGLYLHLQATDRDRGRPRFRHWTPADGLADPWVRVIYQDPRGDDAFWIGTAGGLSRLEAGQIVPDPRTEVLAGRRVRSVLVGLDETLWVGTDSGLFHHAGGRWHQLTTADGLGSNAIRPLFEDAEGQLWIGTAGGGLSRHRNGIITTYGKRNGLLHNDVWGLVQDDRGHLWWSTDGGISSAPAAAFDEYDAGQISRLPVRGFGLRDGMQQVEGNGRSYPAAWKSDDGHLWMTSTVGVHRVDPRPLPWPIPEVQIESWSAGGIVEPQKRTEPLPFERNDLEIRYAAPTFHDPHGLQFSYRLDGHDAQWRDAGSRRVAYYTGVREGQYTFRVRVAEADGSWSESEATLGLAIAPPPWRSTRARWLYTLAAAGLLFLAYRAHRGQLRAELAQQQEDAERDRQIIERLRELDRLKDDFLGGISEQLRSPLFGMMSLAESLIRGARGDLEPEVLADLSMIAASGQRLAYLVRDIGDFSQLRHRGLRLQLQPVDLRSVVEIVLTSSRFLLGTREIELVNSVPARLPPAQADENRLQQILHNLVGNALEHTESGTIEVTAEVGPEALAIQVSDTGIGLSDETQARLFDPPALDESRQSTRGNRLAMAITAELIELHGGRIAAHTTAGSGSTFVFTLPVATQGKLALDEIRDTEPTSDDPEAADPAGALPPGPPTVDSVRGRVLVVDDEPINLHIISNYLALEGFETELASSGETALELFRQGTFDLVILDVMMPIMSGYEVCRTMRETHPIESLPILFLSAMNESSDRIAGLDMGANDFLTKPISRSELLSRVETHLELLAAHRALDEEVRGLRGLLPICAHCQKVRSDDGYWKRLEDYLATSVDVLLSHGICPSCIDRHYGELDLGPIE